MSFRKYLNDYDLEEYVDKNGRTRRRAVYIGGYFVLHPPLSAVDRKLIPALSVFSWIVLVGALMPLSTASQLWYAMLPLVFSGIPLFLMTGPSFILIMEDEKMTRERAERASARLPLFSLIAGILSGIAFLGLITAAVIIREDMLIGDLLFGILSLLLSAATSFIYVKCRKIKPRLIDP